MKEKFETLFSSKIYSFVVLIILALIGLIITNENLNTILYNIVFHPAFYSIALLSLGFALITIIFPEKFNPLKDKTNQKISKFFYYILFAPIVFYPIFRCYFKIPFTFCHVCPRRCIFGYLRPYLVPSVLLLNLDKRHWCFKQCPYGHLQDKQSMVSKIRVKLPKFLSYSKYVFLLLLVVGYFLILNARKIIELPGFNFYLRTFKNVYSFSLIVFVVALLIFLIAFFIPRFWCNYFCPIGTFSDEALKAEKKIFKE